MANTIAYIDGFNLYYGIIDKRNVVPPGETPFSKEKPWLDLLWCNLDSLLRSFNLPNVNLNKIKFFEAASYRADSMSRQQVYMNALSTLETMKQDSFYGGFYKERVAYCEYCAGQNIYYTEKGTDVQLAVELLTDVLLKRCDSAIIVSGDNDLLPAYKKIKEIEPKFPLYVIFPPHRRSHEVIKTVGQAFTRRLKYDRLKMYQLPDEIRNGDLIIKRPLEYTRHP